MAHIIKWVAPTIRADGSALKPGGIVGYNVFVDGVSVAQTGAVTSFDLLAQPFYKTMTPGAHRVTIQAVDKYGAPSAMSAPVIVNVAPPAAPAAPTGVILS